MERRVSIGLLSISEESLACSVVILGPSKRQAERASWPVPAERTDQMLTGCARMAHGGL
jgi:hypothetical protein